MTGSKRVAFLEARLEALSFWLTPCAFPILLSSFLLGGSPHWLDRLRAALPIQGGRGDGLVTRSRSAWMGISIILAGFNIIVMIICYWLRRAFMVAAADVRLGDAFTTGFLLSCWPPPVLVGGMYMIITGPARRRWRSSSTNSAGSSYLYEDLFWFFGHSEVHILALAGVRHRVRFPLAFTRKPLFGYKIAAGPPVRRRDPVVLRLAAPPVPPGQTRTCGRPSC